MMCIGWNTTPHCMGRISSVDSATPYNKYTAAQWLTKGLDALQGNDQPCADASWFWWAGAAILALGAMKN